MWEKTKKVKSRKAYQKFLRKIGGMKAEICSQGKLQDNSEFTHFVRYKTK